MRKLPNPVVFTYLVQPIRRSNCNPAWYKALDEAGLEDFRFHDLRHTWVSWHRQAGTGCDELKNLGGWNARSMVDRHAKFATGNSTFAAERLDSKFEGYDLATVNQK